MGAEAEFGIGVLSIDVEQFVVLLGGQGERLGQDASVVETRDSPLPRIIGARPLSLWWGSI